MNGLEIQSKIFFHNPYSDLAAPKYLQVSLKHMHSPVVLLFTQALGSLYICQNTEFIAAPIVEATEETIWKPIDAFA